MRRVRTTGYCLVPGGGCRTFGELPITRVTDTDWAVPGRLLVAQATSRCPEMAHKKKPEYAYCPRLEMHILGISLNEIGAWRRVLGEVDVLQTLSGSPAINNRCERLDKSVRRSAANQGKYPAATARQRPIERAP